MPVRDNLTAEEVYEANLENLISNDFLLFMLEIWRISSGEFINEKYSLKDRPYMLEIIKDDFPFQVTMKSAQCGISEVNVARAIYQTIYKKRNILYTMPAGEQMQQFVDARARTAIINNQKLAKYVTGSLNLKKFSLNNNQIYFRGVQKRRQIITVDVSSHFGDEIDEYEEGTLYTLTKRLGASRSPERHYFSTPKFHGDGIGLYYFGSEHQKEKGSDQRVWSIKCEHCGKWNEDLLWDENVIDLNESQSRFSYYEPNTIIICRHPKCRKPLNRLSSNAQWVAKFPSLSDHCHGRHISKLFSPVSNLNQMMLDSKDPLKEQEFYNSDLGLPYEPKGSRLTEVNISKARGSHQIVYSSQERCSIGVDIGKVLHYVISTVDSNNIIKVISVGEVDDWTELQRLFRNFKIVNAVIDANPDKDEAVKFQKSQGDGNVWLAYYMQHLEKTAEKMTKDEYDQVVYIHRTLMMMTVSDLIINKHISLPVDIQKVKDFYLHLKSPIKAQKQDLRGDWVTFYPRTKNPDHYYHALLYNIIATMLKPKPAAFRMIRTFF